MTPTDCAWINTPAFAEMRVALAAVGCAGAEAALGPKGSGVPPEDWPSSDRRVRDQFHALWTDLMQRREGLDPMHPRVESGGIRPRATMAKADIIALYVSRTDLRIDDVAAMVGLRRSRVAYIVNAAGVSRPPHRFAARRAA